jgi:hypothetical protein
MAGIDRWTPALRCRCDASLPIHNSPSHTLRLSDEASGLDSLEPSQPYNATEHIQRKYPNERI